MKIFTVGDISNLGTCYHPSKYLPEGWSGTIIDILKVEDCPAHDRLYVVRKSLQLSDKVLRLFAVACAREAMRVTGWTDPRSIAACDVAERFAHGSATGRELAAAADAAYAAYAAADAADAAYAAYAAADAYAYADARKEHQDWQVQTLIELIQQYDQETVK